MNRVNKSMDNKDGLPLDDSTINQRSGSKNKKNKYIPLKKADFSTVLNLREQISQVLKTIHYGAIHAIRDFAVQEGFSVVVRRESPLKPYETLANACRNVFATVLNICPPEDMHCVISYCGGEKEGKPTSERNVWIFAHSSSDYPISLKLGPDHPTTVGANSCYAALLGCEDSKGNKWKNKYRCFTCDNLHNESQYATAHIDWKTWYTSQLVFPLRYQLPDEQVNGDRITGFLEFYGMSHLPNLPSIFTYKSEPQKYWREIIGHIVCHAGGIIADTIATAIFLEKKSLTKAKSYGEHS